MAILRKDRPALIDREEATTVNECKLITTMILLRQVTPIARLVARELPTCPAPIMTIFRIYLLNCLGSISSERILRYK